MNDPQEFLKYLCRISEADLNRGGYEGSSLTYQDIDEAIELIEKLLAERDEARENNADSTNWRWRVTEALRQDCEISSGRAVELIRQLRKALLPFSERHATMHRYYDSETGKPPADVKVPREWLRAAYEALEDVVCNLG
jgi:hypothetical protein